MTEWRLRPWKAHLRFHVHRGPAQGSSSTGARAGPASRLGGFPGEGVAHWGGGQGHRWQRPRECRSACTLTEVAVLASRPGLTQ